MGSQAYTPAAPRIHPTAVVHPKALIHPSAVIGPYAVIGEHSVLDADVEIGPHAVIDGPDIRIGEGTRLGPHVVIQGYTRIGRHNEFFAHASVGQEPQDLKYRGDPSEVLIGDGNRIRENVTINRATKAGEKTVLGNNNLLMAYVHVAHNCVIENHVVIANAVSLAGHILVESKATIGGLTGIHQFVHIGRLCMIGGCSRVERDVPPFVMAEGNPVQVRGLNLLGLKRAQVGSESLSLLKKAYRLIYRSGMPLAHVLQELELFTSNPLAGHLYEFLKTSTTDSTRRGPIRPEKWRLVKTEEPMDKTNPE